jgi:hypothetical protein
LWETLNKDFIIVNPEQWMEARPLARATVPVGNPEQGCSILQIYKLLTHTEK